ncbi:hypothetical protein F5Y09DRAFT_333728 [Xylaria sp. FL1042]|nr:hypothetical protein F5Y09DRAFT_333728 [Xylaria sp. FL1042]
MWEDPHPGERMLVSTDSFLDLQVGPRARGAGSETMSGVAAKARDMSHTHSMVKRSIRLRQRAALKSLRIPAQNFVSSGLKRDDTFSPHTDISTAMAPVQFLPGPEILEPLEVDTDTETNVSTTAGTDLDGAWYDIPKAPSGLPCSFADLSNYMAISRSKDANITTKPIDSPSLSRESSCDTDSYGWESEYERRLDCGNAKLAEKFRCHRS